MALGWEVAEGGRIHVTECGGRAEGHTSSELVFLNVEPASPIPCLVTPVSVILGSPNQVRLWGGENKLLSPGQGPCLLLGPVSH